MGQEGFLSWNWIDLRIEVLGWLKTGEGKFWIEFSICCWYKFSGWGKVIVKVSSNGTGIVPFWRALYDWIVELINYWRPSYIFENKNSHEYLKGCFNTGKKNLATKATRKEEEKYYRGQYTTNNKFPRSSHFNNVMGF